jgi:transposase
MDWEDRLDEWELDLELSAQLEGSDWVTLEKAATETGASRAALRTWYRSGQIPSRLIDGPHGPQRLVPLALVAERAEASPRVRKSAERRLADEAQLELLRHRVDQLELRLAELERRLGESSLSGPRGNGTKPKSSAQALFSRRQRKIDAKDRGGKRALAVRDQTSPNRRSPASPSPGTMYPFSFSFSSTAAVTTRT